GNFLDKMPRECLKIIERKSKVRQSRAKAVVAKVAITADNFELKHGLLTLVQNKQFFRHDKEDSDAHIRYFNKITSTLKFSNVPNTSIKLMLFSIFPRGCSLDFAGERTPLIDFHLG
nr:reverse transcriptase domain-containing protein [Tanacetum cinerariifolium]